MKTANNNLLTSMVAFVLCAGILIFPSCKDDDEAILTDDNICAQLECLNGGNAIRDVEFDVCRCICAAGYSGEHCEVKDLK